MWSWYRRQVGLARTIDLRATIIYKDREPNMHVILQRIQLFVTLLLVIGSPMVLCASEPITVVYGHGRAWLMDLTITGQPSLKKAISTRHREAWTRCLRPTLLFTPPTTF